MGTGENGNWEARTERDGDDSDSLAIPGIPRSRRCNVEANARCSRAETGIKSDVSVISGSTCQTRVGAWRLPSDLGVYAMVGAFLSRSFLEAQWVLRCLMTAQQLSVTHTGVGLSLDRLDSPPWWRGRQWSKTNVKTRSAVIKHKQEVGARGRNPQHGISEVCW